MKVAMLWSASVALLSSAALAEEIPTYNPEALVASGFADRADFAEGCDGKPAILRFNKVKDGGTLKGLKAAAADHKAWVHGKGDADVDFQIFTAFIGAAEEESDPSSVAVGTLITYPSYARMEEILDRRTEDKDAAFDAFVAKYEKNTDGFVSVNLCLNSL